MLGVLILAVTPLKTISHVRSSPFCTAVRENIGHAIGSLLENKPIIGDGKAILLKMSHDKISSASPGLVIDADMVEVDRVIGGLAKNLDSMDAQLNDLKRIPAVPKTESDRRLAEMRDALQAVADRQRRMLDVFSGLYESYSSNELLGKADPMSGATGPDTGAPPDLSAQGHVDMGAPIVLPPIKSNTVHISASPTPSALPNATPTPIPVHNLGFFGTTAYAHLFNAITTYQVQEDALESQAAKTILKYTGDCK